MFWSGFLAFPLVVALAVFLVSWLYRVGVLPLALYNFLGDWIVRALFSLDDIAVSCADFLIARFKK